MFDQLLISCRMVDQNRRDADGCGGKTGNECQAESADLFEHGRAACYKFPRSQRAQKYYGAEAGCGAEAQERAADERGCGPRKARSESDGGPQGEYDSQFIGASGSA